MLFRDLNRLIMDYLTIEGYKTAAEEFIKEADMSNSVNFESIESRTKIREAVQMGDIEDAVRQVNNFNPEVRLSITCCDVPQNIYVYAPC